MPLLGCPNPMSPSRFRRLHSGPGLAPDASRERVFLAGPKGIPFYPPAFARRIAIEPFPLPFATEYCDPIVVANPDEHAQPVGPWQVLDLRAAAAPFPAARLLGQADSVALGGGYNSVWEAHWMGYRARTSFLPFARAIDDQEWRVRASATHVFTENGADTIARWITTA